MADAAPHWTPFRYGFNNPITVTDPTGMKEISLTDVDYQDEVGDEDQVDGNQGPDAAGFQRLASKINAREDGDDKGKAPKEAAKVTETETRKVTSRTRQLDGSITENVRTIKTKTSSNPAPQTKQPTESAKVNTEGGRKYGGDGSGSFTDISMKVMDAINQWNPAANVWDVVSYSYSGQDRLGNTMTPVEANLKAMSIIPIGKFTVTATSMQHIFRNALGHVNPSSIYSQQRFMRLFSSVASNPKNLVPTVNAAANAAGIQTYQQTFRSGRQIWVQTLNGQIRNAGVNP